ncbi:probable carboxylesterase 9 [Carica papaya]|uniref:probable carboxylesterase 9 n=1 Tax=Carica papaya TaxID=3649 RepID=UPI000B8CC59F|nr:probable carboxylesterase 9 [Carica papaya]
MSQAQIDPYDHLNIVLNTDGTCNRLFDVPSVAANPNPAQGEPAASKDVIISPVTDVTARIFRPTNLPSNDNAIARLPIIIHFHNSGGWTLYDATTAINHMTCAQTASELTVILVSVNYRLAPENRLPAQFDDAIDAITWVKDQALAPDGEPWLKEYGDFSRCYLFGSSNGANIAFNAALRTLDCDLNPMKISGCIFYQPMFGGKNRTRNEIANINDPLMPLAVQDLLWELALPPGVDRDHRYCNPLIEGPHTKKMASLGRCLIVGYGGDSMVDRQQAFVKMLVALGVRVDARFDDAGFHGIEAIDPRRAARLLNLTREFII